MGAPRCTSQPKIWCKRAQQAGHIRGNPDGGASFPKRSPGLGVFPNGSDYPAREVGCGGRAAVKQRGLNPAWRPASHSPPIPRTAVLSRRSQTLAHPLLHHHRVLMTLMRMSKNLCPERSSSAGGESFMWPYIQCSSTGTSCVFHPAQRTAAGI